MENKYHIIPAEWLEEEIKHQAELGDARCTRQLMNLQTRFPAIEIPSEKIISEKSKSHSGEDMDGSAWSFQLGAEYAIQQIFKPKRK